MKETVETRDKAKFLTTIVHDEWLENVIAGHFEKYESWSEYAAWLVVQCVVPEQRS